MPLPTGCAVRKHLLSNSKKHERIIPRRNHQPHQPRRQNPQNDLLALHSDHLIKPIKGVVVANTDLASDFLKGVSSTVIRAAASTAIGADNTVAASMAPDSTAVASKVAETTAGQPAATVLPHDARSARLKVVDRASLVEEPKGAATVVETLGVLVSAGVDIQQGVVDTAADNVSETDRNGRTNARYSTTNGENDWTDVVKAKASKVMLTNDSWKTTSRYRETDVFSKSGNVCCRRLGS